MDLVPCVHCKRHVGVSETACPFCASSLPLQRPQHALITAFTRAAIFSAAAVVGVAGCEDKSAKPAPAPMQPQGSAAGSDDLEKLLDVDQRVVDRGPGSATVPAAVIDAGVPDDAAAIAAAPDAGVRPVDPTILKLKREAMEKRRHTIEETKIRVQVNNKPYGAPPARRRVV